MPRMMGSCDRMRVSLQACFIWWHTPVYCHTEAPVEHGTLRNHAVTTQGLTSKYSQGLYEERWTTLGWTCRALTVSRIREGQVRPTLSAHIYRANRFMVLTLQV